MENTERKERAQNILARYGLKNLTYLGQGFEGVVFHNGQHVYKVVLPWFTGGNKWYTYQHLTFFFEKETYKSFYQLEEVIEFEGLVIEKYPYEPSKPVTAFTEDDVINFLTECWQKKIVIRDCKKENFIRVNGIIKLIDLDGCQYYNDSLFLNACVRMYIFLHENDNPDLKKLQRSAINNFDLPELKDCRTFINKIFANIMYEESKTVINSFEVVKRKDLIYESYSMQQIDNLEQLFFNKIKQHLYLCDIQIKDIRLSDNNTFVPEAIIVGYKKLQPLQDKVSLLIKTCAQDVETIEQNIKHIVRQLSCPNIFHEVIVSIDSKKDNFIRQFTENADFEKVINIVDTLKKEGVIDRYFIFNPDYTERINWDWFGLSTNHTHSSSNVPISSQLYAFEQCSGDYIFQMDSDVMIGRRDIDHSYMQDMLAELKKNEKVISVGFNICNSQSKAYFGFENGGYVPEVRMGLFDKQRMFRLRPFPNTLDCDGRLQLTWYRSLEKLQKETGYCSIRGGDNRTFYVHPQNYRKSSAYSWMNILDRVEQNIIPDIQYDHFDCEGSFYDWCTPKRNETLVVLSCFKNITVDKFLRMWCSLISQSFQDFGILFYDDCSDNGMSLFIEQIIKPYQNRITFIKGRTHLPKLQCEYIAIHKYCNNPDSIIVCIDTDDALVGREALYDVYKKYEMWGVDMTCGRVHQTYRLQPHYRYPVNFMEPRKNGGNVWQHLKTFRKYLFDSIPMSYFKYNNAELKYSQQKWFEKCDDYAMMISMVEMSSSPFQMDFINYYYERDYEKRNADRALKEQCIKEILSKRPLTAATLYKNRKIFKPNQNKIEIDITFDCNLRCEGCNRSCGLAPSKDYMTIEDIGAFITESKKLHRSWRLINVLGGEPTLHPDFIAILKMLQTEYADVYNNDVIIQVVSNGFTENSRRLCKEAEQFQNVRIDYESFKTKNTVDYFTPFADAPVDDPDFNSADFGKGCWVTSYCGIGLNKNGYFACSVCGAISRVLKDGGGIPYLKDATEETLVGQLKKYCRYCGNFKHYAESDGDFLPRCEKAPFRNIISPFWEKVYGNYNVEK